MAVKVNFQLVDSKAEETTLFCNINYGLFSFQSNGKKKYLPLKYTTNIRMRPKLWNSKNNRAKESIKWADNYTYDISKYAVEQSARRKYESINRQLAEFEKNANDIITKLTINGRPPRHDQVRRELDKIYNPTRVVGNIDEVDYRFFTLIQFIEHIINTSASIKTSTKRSYKVVKNNIEEYQKEHKTIITPQNADIDFYNSFVEFLTDRGLSKNTIGTRIKIVKTVLNFADDKIDDVCQDFKKKSFSKPSEPTISIYLKPDEINSIYILEPLPNYLDKVRDLFVIGCDTGLRFSDLTRLTKSNFNDNGTISIRTKKTEEDVIIPMTPRVKTILEKHNYQLPTKISNQKYNKYIKDVAKLAGINDTINIPRSVKGMLYTKTFKKWELVSSHTSRRSFATNAYNANVPTISIMKITGHKTEEAFMRYIKNSAEDNAKKLQNHQFFTQMAVVK